MRSITRTRGVGREPAHRGEEIVDRHSARPRARAPPGIASGRSRRCRNRPRSPRNARHGRARGRSHASIPSRRTSPMVTTRLPAAIASSCIARLLAKLASPTCAMLRARQPVLDQRAHRIAVAQALVEVAHVEMGVERDQPDLVERHAEPEHAGPGHRIVAADQQGQRVALRRSPRPRRGSDRRRLLDASGPASVDVAAVGDLRRQLAPGLDVVAADPPQRLRAAAPAQGRSGPASPNRRPAARRPARPARPRPRRRAARKGWASPLMALTVAAALA